MSPEEWFQLLKLRTTGKAAKLISRAEELEMDNAEAAVDFIWEEFERKFRAHPDAARRLMKELREFPMVSREDPERLWSFAEACRQAVILARTEQGRELAILDIPNCW